MVVQVTVELDYGVAVGYGKNNYTVPVVSGIQRSETALLQQGLGFFQAGFHGKAYTQKLIA